MQEGQRRSIVITSESSSASGGDRQYRSGINYYTLINYPEPISLAKNHSIYRFPCKFQKYKKFIVEKLLPLR